MYAQRDVEETVQSIKGQYQRNDGSQFDNENNNHTDVVTVEEDVVDDKWRKPRYTNQQLRKKKDAVSLLLFLRELIKPLLCMSEQTDRQHCFLIRYYPQD